MDTRMAWAFVATFVLLVLLLIPRPTLRRWLMVRPNLPLSRLKDLLQDPNFVEVKDLSYLDTENLDVHVQLRGVRERVIYAQARSASKNFESLDISVAHTSGLILYFENQRVTSLVRVGGNATRNPQLSLGDLSSITTLLARVRNYVDLEKDGYA